jgi:hypothetical protein
MQNSIDHLSTISFPIHASENNYIRAFDLATPGTNSDTWALDAAFNNTISGNNPDVTYRNNSLKCVVWDVSNEIHSNFFQGIKLNSASLPRVTTSGVNQRDIYLTWLDEYNVIGDSNLEKVLSLRELYP